MRAFAAQPVTVEQLSQILFNAASHHLPDLETARRISVCELTERITEDRLATMQSRAPGKRTAAMLEELAEKSAFLEPPVDELNLAAPPPVSEQKAIFARVVDYIAAYARRLPNLITTQTMRRFDDFPFHGHDPTRQLGKLFLKDVVAAETTNSMGKETVKVKTLNGRPYDGKDIYGVISSGDFGNVLLALVNPQSKTKAYWSHWEMLHGKRLAVFRYAVEASNSQYEVDFGCEGGRLHSYLSGYRGFLFVEPDSGTIIRITRTAVNLPPDFPTQLANAAVDYAPIVLGQETYMLPIRGVTELDNPIRCNRYNPRERLHSLNVIRFSHYRLFTAESHLLADDAPTPQPSLPMPPIERSEVAVSSSSALASPHASAPTSASTDSTAFDLPPAPPFKQPDIISGVTYSTHATFRERVNIVTVPVVVRDAHGQALPGLTKDDFELSDNGKRQTISNFAEETASDTLTPPSSEALHNGNALRQQISPPNRFLAFVFDDLHLSFTDLVQTRAAAERATKDLTDQHARLAVITTSGRIATPFTADRDKIIAAFNRILPAVVSAHNDCPNINHYMADMMINHKDSSAIQVAAEETQKVCGITNPQVARQTAISTAQSNLAFFDNQTQRILDAIRRTASSMAVLPGERSLILVSSGFYVSKNQFGIQDLIERTARSGVVIQALDARGLQTPAGFDASEDGSPSVAKLNYMRTAQQLAADSMADLADSTGGRLFKNSNDYDAGFTRLFARPTTTYLLGFSPSNDKPDGKYHKLKVTLKAHKGVDIQARHGYLAATALSNAAQQSKDEIQNALLSRDDLHDIPVTLQPTRSADNKLAIFIKIDPKPVHFQKQGDTNRDTLTLTFGFFDANGALLDVARQDLPLSYTDADFAAALASGLNLKTSMVAKPDAQFLRFVLRDAEGQMATLSQVLTR